VTRASLNQANAAPTSRDSTVGRISRLVPDLRDLQSVSTFRRNELERKGTAKEPSSGAVRRSL
jgi:hypothetical protein